AAEYLSQHWSEFGLSPATREGQAAQRVLDGLVRRADHDGQLEEAVRQSGRVVLPIVFEIKAQGADAAPEPSGTPLKSPLMSFRRYAERGHYPPPSASEAGSPIPRLTAAARELGHVTMLADSDGTTRWEALAFEYKGYYYPSLAVQAARLALGVDANRFTLDFGRSFDVGSTSIPVDARNRMLVDYAGPGGTFPHLSVVDLLAGKLPRDAVKDR